MLIDVGRTWQCHSVILGKRARDTTHCQVVHQLNSPPNTDSHHSCTFYATWSPIISISFWAMGTHTLTDTHIHFLLVSFPPPPLSFYLFIFFSLWAGTQDEINCAGFVLICVSVTLVSLKLTRGAIFLLCSRNPNMLVLPHAAGGWHSGRDHSCSVGSFLSVELASC